MGAEMPFDCDRMDFSNFCRGWVEKLKLANAIQYFGARSLEQIAEAIGECDVGIIGRS
jgi:hypothetical protein